MTDQLLEESEITAAQLSRTDWIHLVWGFFWRGICFTLACTLAGFLIGFLGGFIAAAAAIALAIPRESYLLPLQLFNGAIGLGATLFLFTFYIRWLLHARFGSLRLALIRSVS